ncbi:hypothetical protein D3C73_1295990 [compost metagenome]
MSLLALFTNLIVDTVYEENGEIPAKVQFFSVEWFPQDNSCKCTAFFDPQPIFCQIRRKKLYFCRLSLELSESIAKNLHICRLLLFLLSFGVLLLGFTSAFHFYFYFTFTFTLLLLLLFASAFALGYCF